MPDHVELRIRQSGQSADLLCELLHTVLAEEALASIVSFEDECSRKGLGYRHQHDVGWILARTLGRVCDAVMDGGQIGRNIHGPTLLRDGGRNSKRPSSLTCAGPFRYLRNNGQSALPAAVIDRIFTSQERNKGRIFTCQPIPISPLFR